MIQISKAFVVSSVLTFAACGGSEHNANSADDASGPAGYSDSPAITTEEKGGPGTLSPPTESTSPGGASTGSDTTTGTGTGSPGNTGTAGSTGTGTGTGTAGSTGTTMGTGTSTGATGVTGP
jgi:hypothetical protein